MRGGAGAELRRSNLSRLVTLVHAEGPMRRAEITERLGASRSSVASLVESLTAAGVLAETDAPATNDRGRPSPLVVANERIAVLAAEIAVEHTRLALVGLGGRTLEYRAIGIRSSEVTPATLLDAVRATAADLVTAAGPGCRVVGCCVAVHGTVDAAGHLVGAPNIGWPAGTPLTQAWVEGVTVQVANDAALGAIGEHRRGAGRGFDDLWYISSERGVGGSLLSGGESLSGIAGEVGHMRVRPNGHRCGCGSIGCWETEIGTSAFLRKANSVDSPAATLDRAVAGDCSARAAALDVAGWFGTGIASLTNILGPRRFVIGGFLGDLFDAFPEPILDAARAGVLGPYSDSLDLVRSALGHDAAVVGAAETAFGWFLDRPVDG